MDLELLLALDLDVQNRIIYIMGEINTDMAKNVIKGINVLKFYNAAEPINIYINSEGGDADAGFAIYDAIRRSTTPIRTLGTGSVCSAALLILVAGHIRACTEHVYAMAHSIQYMTTGNMAEVESQTKSAKHMNERVLIVLASHTRLTVRQWKARMAQQGEVWMDAEDLFIIGAVHEIRHNPKLKKSSNTKRKANK